MNLEWKEINDKDKLNKHKKRFTRFLTSFANREERNSDGLKGGIYLHIMPPETYLDDYITDWIKPKRFDIKHWKLIEKWWMIPDDEMIKLRAHYDGLNNLLTGLIDVLTKVSIKKCNRIPSKFNVTSRNQLLWILLSKMKDYEFGRFSTIQESKLDKGRLINNSNVSQKEMLCKMEIKLSKSRVECLEPKRKPPIVPKQRKRKTVVKFNTILSKKPCRLSLVKVLGEYWGWDYYYTQFRFKKKDSPKSKTEVIIKEFNESRSSMVKHLIWCFKTERLWFETISKTTEILSSLI
jgi:hypothetical protein